MHTTPLTPNSFFTLLWSHLSHGHTQATPNQPCIAVGPGAAPAVREHAPAGRYRRYAQARAVRPGRLRGTRRPWERYSRWWQYTAVHGGTSSGVWRRGQLPALTRVWLACAGERAACKHAHRLSSHRHGPRANVQHLHPFPHTLTCFPRPCPQPLVCPEAAAVTATAQPTVARITVTATAQPQPPTQPNRRQPSRT